MNMDTTRQCTRCRITKPTSEFGRRTHGGLRSWCKACTALYQRQYHKKYVEAKSAYLRKWYREHPEAK